MDETLKNLKQAVALSPDNAALRKVYAKELYNHQYYQEAAEEYKAVIRLLPGDENGQLMLALCFWNLDRPSAAAVLADELEAQGCTLPSFRMLQAQLALHQQDWRQAKAYYEQATREDLALKNAQFEQQLQAGIQSSGAAVSNAAEGSADQTVHADVEKPAISFQDVGGLDEVKKNIALKIIHPLKNPEIYKAYGKKTGGGVLLYGPPGCGKTLLARATAGEIDASFINVGINDVLDMWVGNSEKNLHELFQRARERKPCVLFFDEVDALGASRSNRVNAGSRFVVNQFLEELDGVRHSNDGILVLAASNCPWYLDAAFRRPGRFDRIIFVPPPDEGARETILKLYLEPIPTTGNLNYKKLVKLTHQYSGADLKAVVDRAVEDKLEASLAQGKVLPIDQKDLIKAAKAHAPSTKEWLATAKNHVLYANQSGLYDDVMHYLNIKK